MLQVCKCKPPDNVASVYDGDKEIFLSIFFGWGLVNENLEIRNENVQRKSRHWEKGTGWGFRVRAKRFAEPTGDTRLGARDRVKNNSPKERTSEKTSESSMGNGLHFSKPSERLSGIGLTQRCSRKPQRRARQKEIGGLGESCKSEVAQLYIIRWLGLAKVNI